MSAIKLFLDEDVWLGLAAALRERGFDIVHVYEVKRDGLSDAEQLAYAAQEQRVILTHNSSDYVELVRQYCEQNRSHAGVILSPQLEKGELLHRSQRLIEALSAERAADTVRFLSDYR